MSDRTLSFLLALVLGLALALLFVVALPIPFLSDDYEFLKVAAASSSLLDAFAVTNVAPKPIHYLVFYWGAHHTGPDPAWMRVPAFLGHALALFFVHRLARQVGAGAVGALLATLLYAAFATERSLLWPAAVSGLVRVTFALGALSFFLDYERAQATTQRVRAALATSVCVLLAVASHQSGALTPVYLLLWIALREGNGLAGALRRGLSALRHPAVLLAFAVVGLYLLWSLRGSDQYRALREPGAIAANALRALVALLPAELRELIVEGMRGVHGAAGRIAGGAGALLAAAMLLALFWRGGTVWRLALLAGAIDLGLTVSAVGFSQRYAYFAAALATIAIGKSFASAATPRNKRLIASAAAVLGIFWLVESIRITRELREAGELARTLLDQAERASRAATLPLVFANLPDVWGRQRDLPLFNWGFAAALELRGVVQPLVEIRTLPARTSTRAALVDEAELLRLRHDPARALLEYDPEARGLVLWRAGQRHEVPR